MWSISATVLLVVALAQLSGAQPQGSAPTRRTCQIGTLQTPVDDSVAVPAAVPNLGACPSGTVAQADTERKAIFAKCSNPLAAYLKVPGVNKDNQVTGPDQRELDKKAANLINSLADCLEKFQDQTRLGEIKKILLKLCGWADYFESCIKQAATACVNNQAEAGRLRNGVKGMLERSPLLGATRGFCDKANPKQLQTKIDNAFTSNNLQSCLGEGSSAANKMLMKLRSINDSLKRAFGFLKDTVTNALPSKPTRGGRDKTSVSAAQQKNEQVVEAIGLRIRGDMRKLRTLINCAASACNNGARLILGLAPTLKVPPIVLKYVKVGGPEQVEGAQPTPPANDPVQRMGAWTSSHVLVANRSNTDPYTCALGAGDRKILLLGAKNFKIYARAFQYDATSNFTYIGWLQFIVEGPGCSQPANFTLAKDKLDALGDKFDTGRSNLDAAQGANVPFVLTRINDNKVQIEDKGDNVTIQIFKYRSIPASKTFYAVVVEAPKTLVENAFFGYLVEGCPEAADISTPEKRRVRRATVNENAALMDEAATNDPGIKDVTQQISKSVSTGLTNAGRLRFEVNWMFTLLAASVALLLASRN